MRITVAVGVLLAVIASAGLVATRLLIDRWEGAIGRDDLLGSDARNGGPGSDEPEEALTGPLTYLVIGTDRRPDDDDQQALADAIVIVHLPAGLDDAYLISIPRDLRVPIPGHGTDKINTAYQAGGGGGNGARLLARTVSDLTGVGFDGAAVLDFAGFEEVIDAIGGVEMCLERPVRSIHTGEQFSTGCQRLSGGQALDLARQRYGLPEGDLDRGRHHQQLISAMVAQVRSSGLLTNPLRLDKTIHAAGEAVTVDTGGVPLPQLAYSLRQLRPDHLTGITLPSHPEQIDGVSYVVADPAADSLYRALRHSDLADWAAAHPRWHND